MIKTAANAQTDQLTIRDTIVRGDSWLGARLVVTDDADPQRDFDGTTARWALYDATGETLLLEPLPVNATSIGQCAIEIALSRSFTAALSTSRIRGEIEFNFPQAIGGATTCMTPFLLSLAVQTDRLE